MESKIKIDLEKAKTLFYSWRLLEAYQIFRRYYDRLPFKPEPEHAEYIGMFTRTLLELGKDWELKFYMGELEKLYKQSKSVDVGYQLAHVYMYSNPPQLKDARALFESLLPQAKSRIDIQHKARICLAYCYDVLDRDTASVKKLVDSITGPIDPNIALIVEVWRAKTMAQNGKTKESESHLLDILSKTDVNQDWYGHFVAKHMLGLTYLAQSEIDKTRNVIEELKHTFAERNFKSVKANIENLELMLKEVTDIGEVTLEKIDKEIKIGYKDKTTTIQGKSQPEKLLVMLFKKKSVDKKQIAKAIFDREYVKGKDDKLISQQVSLAQRSLKAVGIPEEAIEETEEGFLFVPEVNWTEVGI